jgi:hypothetical protein
MQMPPVTENFVTFVPLHYYAVRPRLQSMEHTFNCGHSQENDPAYMGRGQARLRRLAAYFNRPCLACAEQKTREHLASLTDMHGNPRPANQETVSARLDKLRRTY